MVCKLNCSLLKVLYSQSMLLLSFFSLKCTVLVFKVDGGANLSIKMSWSQKLLYRNGEFSLDIPFKFPEFVIPPGKKYLKKERIQLNVNSGLGTEILCKAASHPLKVQF